MKELNKEAITKIIAAVAVGGLFLYGYFAYFWSPYSKKIDENKKKIEKIDKDIMEAKRAKAEFKNLEDKLKELQIEKSEAEKKLPKEKRVPDLIQTVKRLSDKYGVKIVNINPSSSSRDQYFTKANYTLSISGKFHNVGRFFTAVALEERILNVENVTFSQADAATGLCGVTFTLSAYQYGG